MNAKQAIAKLAKMGRRDDGRNALIAVVLAEVEPLCQTHTSDQNSSPLGDWLIEGEYYGDETPQSIAAEWDSIDAQ